MFILEYVCSQLYDDVLTLHIEQYSGFDALCIFSSPDREIDNVVCVI